MAGTDHDMAGTEHDMAETEQNMPETEPCGPGKGVCPADFYTRLDNLNSERERLQHILGGLSCVCRHINKQVKKATKERDHLFYHLKTRPANPITKMCPGLVAPPPISKELKDIDFETLCCKYRDLWPLLTREIGEIEVLKIERDRLKAELQAFIDKYEPVYQCPGYCNCKECPMPECWSRN